jgi:Stress responsive A/B Barrel Domain
MFSHIVIFKTDPARPDSPDKLIDGINTYLKSIPGAVFFHVGKMVPSHRAVVDQSYQVALNVVFESKKAQDDYQAHPRHIEFLEKTFKPLGCKVVVYDFE